MGSPGAKDGPSGDRSDGSTDYHRDGGNSGAQDSRAGGANPHCTSGVIPTVPNCVTTNDHGSPANHRSTNHLLRSTSHHLWRLHWRNRRRLWRRLNHHVGADVGALNAKLEWAVDACSVLSLVPNSLQNF